MKRWKEVEEVAGSVLPCPQRQVEVRKVQEEEAGVGDDQAAYQDEGHRVQEGEEDHPKDP